MLIFSYLHLTSAIAYLLLAIYVVRKNWSSPLNRTFSSMMFCFFIWSFCETFTTNPYVNQSTARLFTNIGSVGWLFFGSFYLWFAAVFTARKRMLRSPLFYLLLFGIPGLLLYQQFVTGIVGNSTLHSFGWVSDWQPPWSYVYFAFYGSALCVGMALIFQFRRQAASGFIRRQLDIMLIMTMITLILATCTDVIFQTVLARYDVPPLADVYILVLATGIGFSIARYQFLNLTPIVATERIVSTITDMLVLLDMRGNIAWANASALNSLGYTHQDLEGRPVSMLFAAESTAEALGERIVRGDHVNQHSAILATRSGEPIPVSLTTAAIRRSGILCTAHDMSAVTQAHAALQRITEELEKKVEERTQNLRLANDDLTKEIIERKRIEEELLDSQERLKVLFECAPDAYFIMDLKGTLLDGNKKAEEFFGFAKGELIGKNIMRINLLSPPQVPQWIRGLVRNIAGESTGPDEYIINKSTGARVHLEIISHPIVLKGKKVVLGMARDISARRRSEAALRASEEKFRLTFENSRDAIFWLDPLNYTITHCNRAAETLLECQKEAIIGQNLTSFVAPERVAFYTEELRRNLQEKRNFELDAEVVASSKEIKTVRIATTAIIEGEQKLVQFVCHDITQQKIAEREKAHLEDQLRHAQKMEAIGRLAGGIAHDFNNVLGAISGYADMIRQKYGAENPKLDKYASTIFSAASRAADLTAKLLAFARKGKLEMVAVDLHETIQDALGLLERTIPKSISISHSLTADPPTVSGERIQLQNVIINLALNARDAMPQGGTLRMTTKIVTLSELDIRRYPFRILPGSYFVLQVADTGLGMDEETKSRLFEPFFTTKERGKGTGLGLASVYGTVKSHNGYIEVESETGKGTVFTLYFPSVAKPIVAAEQEPAVIQPGSGRILIVDDEEHIRGISGEMLNDLGYETELCRDGEEAVAYYRNNHAIIDLVVLDIIMPRMNGYNCFQELRKINPKVKVIISSGYAIDTDARRMINQGALDFIQKPFDMKTLSNAVKKALTGGEKV